MKPLLYKAIGGTLLFIFVLANVIDLSGLSLGAVALTLFVCAVAVMVFDKWEGE